MSSDGDLASVRIEVDAAGGTPDAPEVAAASSGGGPKWVLALAAVAAVVVVAAVLVLRPSGDEAADGSERAVPTTIAPITPSTTTVPEDAPELILADDIQVIQQVFGPQPIIADPEVQPAEADFAADQFEFVDGAEGPEAYPMPVAIWGDEILQFELAEFDVQARFFSELSAFDISTDEVADCAAALSAENESMPELTGSIVNTSTGEVRPIDELVGRFVVGGSGPVDGTAAFIDFGRDAPGAELRNSCRGIIELPSAQDPSIVIVEPGAVTVRRIPADEISPSVDRGRVHAIGVIDSEVDDRQHVVVRVGRAASVWLVDVQTGQWLQLGSSQNFDPAFFHAVSTSGRRIYALSENSVVAHDVDFSSDGVTRVQTSTVTFPSENRLDGVVGVLDADDESVLFSTGEELLSLRAPAVAEPIDVDAPSVLVEEIDEANLVTIIEAEVGFLGLDGSASDRRLPPILRSIDGTEWFEVETTISGQSALDDLEASARLFWFDLSRNDDGFSVRVLVDGTARETPETLLFTSAQSGTWRQQSAEFTPPGSPGLFDQRRVIDGFSVSSETLGDVALNEVITSHTSLDLGGVPACGALFSPNQISIESCAGESVQVAESDVVSSFAADQVLSCIEFLGERAVFTSRSVRVDLSTGQVEPFEGSEVSFDFLGTSELDDGLLASIDVGDTSLGSSAFVDSLGDGNVLCDGLADIELSSVPSMLVLDVANLGVQRIPLPDAIDVIQFGFRTRILGELESNDGTARRVLVGIDNEVWALDLATETWTEVLDASLVGPTESPQIGYDLSVSGRRAYRIEGNSGTNGPSGLVAFDLGLETDGSISLDEQRLRLDTVRRVTPVGRVLFANDDVIFYNDSFSDANLLLTIPEVGE